MKIPLIDKPDFINELMLFSVYDTETYTVSVYNYEELLDLQPDILTDKCQRDCMDNLRKWLRETFYGNLVKLSDTIYFSVIKGSIYFHKNNRLYCMYNQFDADIDVPVLFNNNELGIFNLHSFSFATNIYKSKKEITLSSFKRKLLLDTEDILEIPCKRNVSAVKSIVKQGEEFGYHEYYACRRLCEYSLAMQHLPQRDDIIFIENSKNTGLKFSYIQVYNDVFCIRMMDLPKTQILMLRTDSNGITDMPLYIFTKLKYKDIRVVMQMLAFKPDEDALIQNCKDYDSIDLGIKNLNHVLV